MLDPAVLRGQLDAVTERLKARGFALPKAQIEALEAQRKAAQTQTQELQNLRNTRSKAIGMAKGKGEDTTALMAEVAGIGDQLKANEEHLAQVQADLAAITLTIPNLPDESVPFGVDETQNVEVHRWGTPRTFDFAIKDHVDLGVRHGWLDGDAGAKLSGARFTVLRGQLAHLHRALAQFMLDLHTAEHAYLECNVPLLVNEKSMQGTGQLPKFEDDLFETMSLSNSEAFPDAFDRLRSEPTTFANIKYFLRSRSTYFLIPTAEVSLTNLVANEIVDA
ncbi:MAG: serine--tRNA ligase, partial [Rudaea sp.]